MVKWIMLLGQLKQYKLIFTHLKEIYNKVIDDSIEQRASIDNSHQRKTNLFW